MNVWRPYPLVRLLFPFLAGILSGIGLAGHFIIPVWFSIGFPALAVIFYALPGSHHAYRYRGVFGMLVFGIIFFIGFQLVFFQHAPNRSGFIGRNPEGLFLAVVKEPPVLKGDYYRAVLEIDARSDGENWSRAAGRILASCRISSWQTLLQYGDAVLIKGVLHPIESNANPHAFDYASFLKSKGITHQALLSPHQWRVIAVPEVYKMQRFAYVFRDKLMQIFREQNITGREFGVASALLLGYTNGIDPDLRREYSATGAMHILSVSGMHVGIIYLFLEFLLSFMGKRRRTRMLKTVILMTFIWFYALLTGLSPSVIRASTMLSFIILGRSLDRSPDMYNILSASLILILTTNPFLIIDIGFQLSYLAVLGIVIFYKPIYELILSPIWIADKIWSIVACSLAATISTLPLTLFTFHQFPNYFILTNIAVVPLSSVIIYSGILALVVSPVYVLSQLAGTVFNWMIWLLNLIIHTIDEMPFSTTTGIFITPFQMLLLYLLIVLIFLFLSRKRQVYIWLLFSVLIALQCSFLVDKINRLSQFSLIVYNFPGCLAIDLLAQDRAYLYYREKKDEDGLSAYASEIVRNAGYARGVKRREFFRAADGVVTALPILITEDRHRDRSNCFIQFMELKIAVLRQPVSPKMKREIALDYLIISGNPFVTIREICRVFHVKQIIIDGTNDGWRARRWLREAQEAGISCHAVSQNGAFVKDF
jgi:competence protein ComEC